MSILLLEQPRRGKTREAQLTPHKAEPQCGAVKRKQRSVGHSDTPRCKRVGDTPQ